MKTRISKPKIHLPNTLTRPCLDFIDLLDTPKDSNRLRSVYTWASALLSLIHDTIPLVSDSAADRLRQLYDDTNQALETSFPPQQ